MVLRIISVKLEDTIIEELELLALRYKTTRSQLIREALIAYIEKQKELVEKRTRPLKIRNHLAIEV